MSRATPKMRDFAERLIAYEMSGDKSFETKAPAVFYVCETLRPHLAILMGDTGFHALLSRALVLAYAHVSWLQAVQVKADGSGEASAPGRDGCGQRRLGFPVAFTAGGVYRRKYNATDGARGVAEIVPQRFGVQ